MLCGYEKACLFTVLFIADDLSLLCFKESPVIVDIDGEKMIKTILPTEPDDKDESIKAYVTIYVGCRLENQLTRKLYYRSSSYVTAVAWNKTGTKLYTGTSKGYLNIIDIFYQQSKGLSPWKEE